MNSASPLTVSRLMAGLSWVRGLYAAPPRRFNVCRDESSLMRSSCFTVSSTSTNRTGLRR